MFVYKFHKMSNFSEGAYVIICELVIFNVGLYGVIETRSSQFDTPVLSLVFLLASIASTLFYFMSMLVYEFASQTLQFVSVGLLYSALHISLATFTILLQLTVTGFLSPNKINWLTLLFAPTMRHEAYESLSDVHVILVLVFSSMLVLLSFIQFFLIRRKIQDTSILTIQMVDLLQLVAILSILTQRTLLDLMSRLCNNFDCDLTNITPIEFSWDWFGELSIVLAILLLQNSVQYQVDKISKRLQQDTIINKTRTVRIFILYVLVKIAIPVEFAGVILFLQGDPMNIFWYYNFGLFILISAVVLLDCFGLFLNMYKLNKRLMKTDSVAPRNIFKKAVKLRLGTKQPSTFTADKKNV